MSFASYSNARDFLPANADNRGKLVVYANSQEELDSKIRTNYAAAAVHLVLASEVEFGLSALGNLKKAEILTLEFPLYSEIGIMGDGGTFNNPIDLSFLQQLQELRYLVIDWSGMISHAESITALPHLIYARIPFDAFSPALFNMQSLRQLEITDSGEFSISRVQPDKRLELAPYGYEKQFDRNRSFTGFNKAARGKSAELPGWPDEIRELNESGDTVLFVSGVKSNDFKWSMKKAENDTIFQGYCNKNEQRTGLVVMTALFKRIVQLTPDHKRITWSDYYKGPGQLTYKEENYNSDGLKDGLFLHTSDNYTFLEEHYKNGKLTYQFPYVGELPPIAKQAYLDHSYPEHFVSSPKEAFFEEGELVTLRTRRHEKSDRSHVITVPVNDLKIDGVLSVHGNSSDTILRIAYSQGIMNGPYYWYDADGMDTVSVYATYKNGRLSGEKRVERSYTTTISNYEEGFITKLVTYINRNRQPVEELIWYPDHKIYREKVWTPDGKPVMQRTLDAHMKLVN